MMYCVDATSPIPRSSPFRQKSIAEMNDKTDHPIDNVIYLHLKRQPSRIQLPMRIVRSQWQEVKGELITQQNYSNLYLARDLVDFFSVENDMASFEEVFAQNIQKLNLKIYEFNTRTNAEN